MSAILSHIGLLSSPPLDPAVAARYWRLNITANDGNVSYFGLTELELKDSIGGTDVTIAAEAGTRATTSSSVNVPNSGPYAFDDLLGTGWLSATAEPSWLKWDFGAGNEKAIVQFTIRGSYNAPTASPKDFTLERSADGSTWTPVLAVTGQTGWTGNTDIRTFTVE